METRKIEEVLHLYLGCEIQYEEKLIFGNTEIRKGLSFGVDDKFVSFYPITKYNKLSESGVTIRKRIKECKPILRPLSDMSEEEGIGLGFSSKSICIAAINNGAILSEQFRILLSKHFDLFGLIEAGLAIDKTSLK